MADRALAILGARYRSYKDDGTVNSGGYVYFYEAGTSTPKDTYSDPEKTTANANPVVLDTRGEASIYGAGAYKIVEQDSDGNQLGDAMDGVLLLDVSDDMLALLSSGTLASLRSSLGLGTAATKDTGTSAGNVVMLDSSGKYPAADGSQITNIAAGAAAMPYGHKQGFVLSRSANTTLGITAGACRDSTNAANIRQTSAFTKTLSSWEEGTTKGALQTGLSLVVSTWYHVFGIYNATSATSDFLVSTSATSPTLPSGYGYFRRIGSFYTDTNPYITDFSQNGDEFLWKSSPLDVNMDGTLGTSGSNQTLTVPTGVKVRAIVNIAGAHGSVVSAIYASSPDMDDEATDYNANTRVGVLNTASSTSVTTAVGGVIIRTNTSGQIRLRSSSATTYCGVTTLGWLDDFGRND